MPERKPLEPQIIPPEIAKKLDPGEMRQLQQVIKFSVYRTIWPPAEVVAEAEKLFPGYGKLMIDTAQKSMQQHTELERKSFENSERRRTLGQWFGYTIVLAGVSMAGYLGYHATNWYQMAVAIVIAALSIGGPTAARALLDKIYVGRRNGNKHSHGSDQ